MPEDCREELHEFRENDRGIQALDPAPRRAPSARNVGLLVGGVVVVELVCAVFLFWMAQLESDSPGTGRALLAGAFAAGVATIGGLGIWVSVRSAKARIIYPVWAARVLPVVALALALVAAAFDAVPWLAAPLAFFATAPVCIVALVVPQLLASRQAPGADLSGSADRRH